MKIIQFTTEQLYELLHSKIRTTTKIWNGEEKGYRTRIEYTELYNVGFIENKEQLKEITKQIKIYLEE